MDVFILYSVRSSGEIVLRSSPLELFILRFKLHDDKLFVSIIVMLSLFLLSDPNILCRRHLIFFSYIFQHLYPDLGHLMQVQKQLQLRINAHRKYLQTILEKAKEALASHIEASPGLAARHADLTELASKVNSESVNISFPPLTLPSLPTYSADAELFDLPRQQSHVSHCSLQKSCVSEVAGIP